jgi:hypothetical protein
MLNIGAVDLFANGAPGTYYDDMSLSSATPWVDAKCNDQEGGITIPMGTNAKIDYTVVAGVGTGANVDLWLVLTTPLGPYSYNGTGPYMGWNVGFKTLKTGPLANAAGNALDFALPWPGSYKCFLAIETKPNGVPDLGNIYVMDVVDFMIQ